MVLWLGVVIAMNVLAVAAVLISVSDRGESLRTASRRDDQNPTGQF